MALAPPGASILLTDFSARNSSFPPLHHPDMDLQSSSWPDEFKCPISGSLMADPVVVSSGQTYERRCIEAWMNLNQKFCVTHSTPLDRNLMVENRVLKTAITNMAVRKGMNALPSPPSREEAHALAGRLVQKLNVSKAGVQERSHMKFQADDASIDCDEEEDKYAQPIRIKDSGNKEESKAPKRWDACKNDILDESMEKLQIGDESGNSPVPEAHAGTSASANQRKGIHLKSTSSLPPFTVSSIEGLGTSRGYLLRGPVSVRSAADRHQPDYASAATDLEQRSDGLGAGKERADSGSADADPRRQSRFISEKPLPESAASCREVPPLLVTRPSSYSSSEQTPSSSLPLSVIDRLVGMLNSAEEHIQEDAAVELRQLSRSQENRIPLCRKDVLESLIPYLTSDIPKLQVNAVASLVNLSIEKPNKVLIVRAGAFPPLVEVLQSGCPEAQVHAAGAAFSLAIAEENKHPISVLNAIPPLVKLLYSGPSEARQDAAMALYHLSILPTNKTKLVRGGSVPILFNLAQSRDNPNLASRALVILANVASIPEGRAALLQLNAVPVLVRLLAFKEGCKSTLLISEQAAAVLVLLAENNVRFKNAAQSAGVHGLLLKLVEKGSARARAKAQALLAIMKESSSTPSDPNGTSVISRQYLRMRVDGEQMNSSAF